MSATLVSSNTTIKVNAAVAASRSSSGTIYTAPANGYAIVMCRVNQTAPGIAGTTSTITWANMTLISTGNIVTDTQYSTFIYVGPSQSVVATLATFATASFFVSGTEFVNTP